MELNHETVRSLLLKVEAEQRSLGWMLAIGSENFEQFYAATKLIEGGFLDGQVIAGMDEDEGEVMITSLTYRGHEFLDSVREPEVWSAAKAGAKKAGAFSLEILAAIARAVVLQQVKQLTGLDVS